MSVYLEFIEHLYMKWMVNKLLEWKLRKIIFNIKSFSFIFEAEIPDPSTWESQDSAQINGIDSVLSKAEIASCSYEARYVGIKDVVE